MWIRCGSVLNLRFFPDRGVLANMDPTDEGSKHFHMNLWKHCHFTSCLSPWAPFGLPLLPMDILLNCCYVKWWCYFTMICLVKQSIWQRAKLAKCEDFNTGCRHRLLLVFVHMYNVDRLKIVLTPSQIARSWQYNQIHLFCCSTNRNFF